MRDIDKREIKIYTDGGRVQRAMFIVENNEIKLRKKHVAKIMSKERTRLTPFNNSLCSCVNSIPNWSAIFRQAK